jgi:membrane protease YdiL (CAAX protease family)
VTTDGPASGATAPSEWVNCWRCGKRIVRAEPSCPVCRAPRRRQAERGPAPEPASPITAVTRVLAFFGVLLLVLIVHSLAAQPLPEEGLTPHAARAHLHSIVAFEIFDAIVVGIAAWAIGRPREWRRMSDAPGGWLWASAVAGIGLVLAVNLAYHTVLRGYIGLSATTDPILAVTGATPLLLFAYCLEPAVIEELFFRYLALDTLRGVMNVHAAVAVSSLMFGLAHIGVPLSIPMLALVGMALGYARVASGRLALPMLLHFLHNFVIVLLRR